MLNHPGVSATRLHCFFTSCRLKYSLIKVQRLQRQE
nr:MAG TPA: hypothetical protein [Caudoviricetes sp.]